MRFVNRTAVVLRARQPYVDWANRSQAGPERVVLAQARAAGSVFLIPAFERADDIRAFVERHAPEMFEHELGMWLEDPGGWPPRRDAATFHEWFDVEVHEIVVDLAGDEIVAEELG